MRKIITLLVLLITVYFTQAQTATRIFGIIKTNDGKTIEAASVSLTNTATKKLIKIAVSNAKGEFEINNVKTGSYTLQVTAVGFEPQHSDTVTVADATTELQVEIKPLSPVQKQLGNVTVNGSKPMVETKIDRTIVNVDAMISNAGTTALEVLEKSPGVMIDKDGNISLKGKQGVIILIDGRPSYLAGQDLADFLRNMPSNQLDQLEIMTQPPAKYDASGNAGLINIKTKKNKANGFNASISLSYIQAVYPKSPNSINVNWRKNKINLFANYGFAYWEGFNEIDILRKFGNGAGGVSSLFDQSTDGRFFSRNHNAKIGLDYSVDKKTTIGVVLNGTINPRDFYSNGYSNISDASGELDSVNVAQSHNHNDWKNAGVNLNARRTLGSKGSEITADGDFIWYGTKMFQTSNNYMQFPDGQPTQPSFLLSGDLPSDIKIYSLKSDYTLPLKKEAKLEAGIKSSYVKTDNNAMYTIYNHGSGKWEEDISRSNHFLYHENINAVYVNYNRQIKKWGIQAGLRLENTIGKGDQLINNEEFKRNYTQLFPTLYISRKLDEKNTLSISYGRRIERPNYQDMNPFKFFLDQFTYRQGNPYLAPEFSNNVELSHNFRGALNTTFNYTYTTDILNDVLKQDDSSKVTFQTKENVGKRTNIGLAISYNAPITKWYTISFYANGYNNHYKGVVNDLPLDVKLFSYMFNINNQFRFAKTWGAEVSGFYRSRTQDAGIIISEPMGVINFAFSKQILKGKGSLKLLVNDPFWLQRFHGFTKFGNIDADIRSQWDNRRVGLTFTYRFGKQLQQQQPRRRTGGATEEQQRVSDGNQQQ